MFKNNPPEDAKPDFASITKVAADLGESEEAKTADERLDKIEEQLASIEPLLEQLEVNSQLGTKLTDYIDDLREEQRFFNAARWGVGFLAFITLVGLIALLGLALFHSQSPLLSANPIAIATFVIGLVSGIALLISSFIKGVFRSATERHSDGYLPPALENSVEVLKKITGKT